MNRTTQRMTLLFIAVLSIVALDPSGARAERQIGIMTYTAEARFVESERGIMDQLKQDGFRDPAVRFSRKSADGSKVKAAELARTFAAAKGDLLLTIGTTATIAAAREIKDVPIVFSIVYDPVEAGIAKAWKSSGNNTTGASARIPMDRLMQSLKLLAPVRRLAVLYTRGERHTEIMLKELQGLQSEFGIKVIPVILSKEEEVPRILPAVLPAVDAIALTGSSIHYSSVPLIVNMATAAKVVTITHIEEFVHKGALLGISANPYLQGRLAGEKAVRVLKGAKPSSIPIETPNKLDIVLNMRTARAGQFQIPEKLKKAVTQTVE
ncbi:MAG: ABC transporter substrate-binding protein [Syntrophales bacterium]